MKFREIFRFEFRYQLQSVWMWLMFIVLAGFAFLFVRVNFIADALYADFYVNAPFFIAGATVFGGLIWLGIAATVAGEAAARDLQTRIHPLIYTTPVSKAAYLGGRFLAALSINAILLLAVQAGMLLAYHLPGVETGLIGPFRPAAYLTAYAFIALPNALVATAIQFLLALRSGRAMAGYLGSFLLVFMGFFVASALLFHYGLGGLLDPIGIRFIVEDLARLWTTVEQNTRLIGLEGRILANRLLWLLVALVALTIAYFGFHFAHRTETQPFRLLRGRLRSARRDMPADTSRTAVQPARIPHSVPAFGFATQVRQALAVAGDSFRALSMSWAGLALLVVIPLLTVPVVIDQMESVGSPLLPATPRVLAELTAPLSAELSRWVIIPLLLVFFAGELIWRERDYRVNELSDTMPGSEWPLLVGKFLGISLLLLAFTTLQMLAGMLAQILLDYRTFETRLYVCILFGLQLPEYLLFAVLALVVHVLVNQKYVGHLVAVSTYVFITMSSLFGIEHNLLVYGASPEWSYTEMRGLSASLGPWLWFKGYWAAWALLLGVMGRLFWMRGREGTFRIRLREARLRFGRATAWTATLAGGLVLALGGYIFYNTNILNEYLSTAGIQQHKADYERSYGRFAATPQPRLTSASLRVEVYPRRRAVDIEGIYQLANTSPQNIDTIHIATPPGSDFLRTLTFNQPARLVATDQKLGHRIYVLARPLRPGESLRLRFQVQVAPSGFREDGADLSITEKGTSFTNSWLPAIGYQKSRELLTASERRKQGLAPRPVIASLYDEAARLKRGEGVAFEAVVGTDYGQVAVAPGALRRTWTDSSAGSGGRRYFHYATSAPIGGEWAFFSAPYAVRETRWQNVAIRIYHHPAHTAHLARMLRSIRASLDYYSRQFGPYPYHHLSVVERPDAPGTGLHAEASLITHGQGFTYYRALEDSGSYDHPYAVVAHEMAHQWTIPYAPVEGAPVMSESLAWYYAIKAVENSRGPAQLEQLMRFLRESNVRPEIRRGEPLLRGLDPYMSYRRGPFALYTLSEYMGDEAVNAALRKLLETHRSAAAPLATTLDLYRELRMVTPDSLRYLLHDLFEVNTYWNLTLEHATAQPTREGTWQVTLAIQARKTVADSAGHVKEVPMNDWVESEIFAPALSEGKTGQSHYRQKLRIRSGRQTIILLVPHKPDRAGIDPRHLLSDPETNDNDKKITIKP